MLRRLRDRGFCLLYEFRPDCGRPLVEDRTGRLANAAFSSRTTRTPRRRALHLFKDDESPPTPMPLREAAMCCFAASSADAVMISRSRRRRCPRPACDMEDAGVGAVVPDGQMPCASVHLEREEQVDRALLRSTAPVESAGCRSAKLICSGLAPSALKMSVKIGPRHSGSSCPSDLPACAPRAWSSKLAETVLAPGQRYHVARREHPEDPARPRR